MPNSMAAVCIMRANWPSPMTATMGMPGVCAAGFPETSWAAAASWAATSFWAGLLQVGWVLSVTPYHFRNHGKNWPTSGWVALVHPPFPRFPPGHLVNTCVAHIAITVPPTEFGVLQRVRCWGHWVYGVTAWAPTFGLPRGHKRYKR